MKPTSRVGDGLHPGNLRHHRTGAHDGVAAEMRAAHDRRARRTKRIALEDDGRRLQRRVEEVLVAAVEAVIRVDDRHPLRQSGVVVQLDPLAAVQHGQVPEHDLPAQREVALRLEPDEVAQL